MNTVVMNVITTGVVAMSVVIMVRYGCGRISMLLIMARHGCGSHECGSHDQAWM